MIPHNNDDEQRTDDPPTDTNPSNDSSPPSPAPPRKRRKRRIIISDDDTDDDTTDLTGIPTTHPHHNQQTQQAIPKRMITTTLTKNLALILHRHKQDDTNFTSPNPDSMKPLTSMIPSLSVATYNVTSLSADMVDEVGLRRQKHMITDIEALTHTASIIFIQETRLNSTATYPTLEAAFPLWRIFYNNPTHNKGGTLIMLSPHTRHHYNTHTEPLSPDL